MLEQCNSFGKEVIIMSDEIDIGSEISENNSEEAVIESADNALNASEIAADYDKPSLLPGFCNICTRLGLMMIVVFVARYAVTLLSAFIYPYVEDLGEIESRLLDLVLSCLFLYAVPMIAAAFILKHPLKNSEHRVYSKPKYFGRAMAMLPAGYGLAISFRLLTMLISSLIPENSVVEDSFHATEDLFTATSMPSAIILFVQLTVIAPIMEELWLRGMVMESLRPYGNGFAIFVSAFLFGLIHANFEQFFYAAALGVFLGYIAVSTQSIVTTTIMHAIFNSISGCMVLLTADEGVADYLLATDKGEDGVVTVGVVLYFAWLAFMMILMAVGIIMLIYKLIKIKRYRVPKVQTELSAKRRWGIFFTTATVIVMLIFALDTFTFQFIPNIIYLLIVSPSHIPDYFATLFGNAPDPAPEIESAAA